MAEISTKPYLIRAIHQWCEDSGYRPYLAVTVDERTLVPREFVRNGEIVLNVSAVATHRLQIGNDLIEFEARFSGTVRQVSIPIENVSAIYAQETGHGMAFDVPKALALPPERAQAPQPMKAEGSPDAPPRPASRPKLVPKPAPAAPAPAPEAPAETAARADGTPAVAPAISLAPVPTEPSAPAASPAVAASAPVLQAVETNSETGTRRPRAASAKPRRRGKLAAVPDGQSAEGGSAPSPASASTEPRSEPAVTSPPEEPPPPPPSRPRLQRVK